MPEQLKPTPLPQSNPQTQGEGAVRRLARSPHPYFRQQFELSHGSERLNERTRPLRAIPGPIRTTIDPEQEGPATSSSGYIESTPSDSGTEADDEHFLKGLPAPKHRPHKGLRDGDASLSGSPSPLLSPATSDGQSHKIGGYSRRVSPPAIGLHEDTAQKVAEKTRQKRRVEIVRRCTEFALLALLAAILCLDPEVRHLLYIWRRGAVCEILIIVSLIALYPLQLLRHINPAKPWKLPLPISLPASFDPAPLLYPSTIALFVSMKLSKDNPITLLPSIILGVSSLPENLIPSVGGVEGSHITHWFLSCLPLLVTDPETISLNTFDTNNDKLEPGLLLLIYPLHQAVCTTLTFLTTTSLLPAELQLLSIALVELLFLASSPQALILKVLLWGGGLGLLVTCSHVLRWGIALARVPKWRFRREGYPIKGGWRRKSRYNLNQLSCGLLGTSAFARTPIVTDSSDGENSDDPVGYSSNVGFQPRVSSSTSRGENENRSISAIVPNSKVNFFAETNGNMPLSLDRRHTLPSPSNLSPRSRKRTPSGRRKRANSSSVQAYFSLTYGQAQVRKWVYAGYVYFWVLTIILVGVREYVRRYALYGNEPIGWALGYFFGDLPWFRMQVISRNLQRWICLPPRRSFENQEFCQLGWVEHLRHATFGESNTRLILSAYYLAVIVVGLAVVFRLSKIVEVDTRRKVFHFMMVGMLLPGTFVDPAFAALALSIMLAVFLLLDLFRATQLPPLSKSIAYFLTPYVDGRDLKGPVVISHIFLLIGCAIPLWLSLGSLPRSGTDYLTNWEIPTREVSMVSGVICVGMGDSAASLIGRRFGRRKWLWGGGKSIEGSVAFATAVSLALVLAKVWLRFGGWQANNSDDWFLTIGKAGVAAWVASLTEAVLTGGNDNVVVPVVLWLCVKGLDI